MSDYAARDACVSMYVSDVIIIDGSNTRFGLLVWNIREMARLVDEVKGSKQASKQTSARQESKKREEDCNQHSWAPSWSSRKSKNVLRRHVEYGRQRVDGGRGVLRYGRGGTRCDQRSNLSQAETRDGGKKD